MTVATCTVADWGADVVKVEPPGLGDPQRVFYQFSFGIDNHVPNSGFHVDNRGKRSITLDLKTPQGAAASETSRRARRQSICSHASIYFRSPSPRPVQQSIFETLLADVTSKTCR